MPHRRLNRHHAPATIRAKPRRIEAATRRDGARPRGAEHPRPYRRAPAAPALMHGSSTSAIHPCPAHRDSHRGSASSRRHPKDIAAAVAYPRLNDDAAFVHLTGVIAIFVDGGDGRLATADAIGVDFSATTSANIAHKRMISPHCLKQGAM